MMRRRNSLSIKKVNFSLFFLILICLLGSLNSLRAQSPSYFDLEAILFNQGQPLANRSVNLTIELREKNSTIYLEKHNNQITDSKGKVYLKVGNGTDPNKLWSNLDWTTNTNKTIKISGYFVGDSPRASRTFAENISLPIVAYAQSLVTPVNIPQIKGNTNIGSASIGLVDIEGKLTVKGNSDLKSLNVSSTANFNSKSTFGEEVLVNGPLNVNKKTSLKKGLSVIGGITSIEGLKVNQNATIDGIANIKGEATFSTTIMANGTSNKYYTSGKFATSNNGWKNHGNESRAVSVYARERVVATRIVTYSDIRVKNKFASIPSSAAIESIKSIRPYEYLLNSDYGLIYRGFKAQELERKLPDAVDRIEGVAPTIYRMAKVELLGNEKVKLVLDTEVSLKKGATLELIAENTYLVEVLAVQNNSIIVNRWRPDIKDEVFVYGEYLKDLRAVDYNYIFTTNVVATQALINRTENLEEEVLAMKAQLSTMLGEQKMILSKLAESENTSNPKSKISLQKELKKVELK